MCLIDSETGKGFARVAMDMQVFYVLGRMCKETSNRSNGKRDLLLASLGKSIDPPNSRFCASMFGIRSLSLMYRTFPRSQITKVRRGGDMGKVRIIHCVKRRSEG